MTRFYPSEIGLELCRLMRATSLTLSVVQPGNINSLPMPGDSLDTLLAAGDIITVECIQMPFVFGRSISEIEPTYKYRILYFRKQADGEIVETTRLANACVILEKLADNWQLSGDGSGVSGIGIQWCKPTEVNFEPTEEKVFDILDQQITVVEIIVEVLATASLR